MHRVIRKHVRHHEEGVNIAADIDAVIAINTGEAATTSRTVVRTSNSVVQGPGGQRRTPDAAPPDSDDRPKEKP
jgi:hypothetical protein